ncbi:MAG: OsmC family protein [Thermoleophilia bacterium]
MSKESVKTALSQAIAGIEKNKDAAKVVFRAQTMWEEDVRCSALVRDFPPMTVDEPAELGGTDKAPNPVELLLVALGTCQEIMYAAYAAVMDIQLDAVNVDCKGNLDLRGLFAMEESVPAGYSSIKFETNIKSEESHEKIRALLMMVEAHCPVLDTLARPIAIAGRVNLNGEELHRHTWSADHSPVEAQLPE